jgi:uncharacterized protein DUF3300
MTRTTEVRFAACQGGRLAVIRPTRSSHFNKAISLSMAFIFSLLLCLTATREAIAQTPVAAYVPLSADQLDQLVAPIALDPDPLIAQILTASTYPDQVGAAETWSTQNISLPADQRASGTDAMPWDPAIKGLIAFPDVLDNMTKNTAWTAQLGNAYYNQPDDVLNAIQALRTQAHEANVLVTTPQVRVVETAGVIAVVPVNPVMVYVPYYNPWRVWGTLFVAYPGYVVAPAPVGVVAVAGIAFEPPVAIAAYGAFSWGFAAWTPEWTSGAVTFNNSTYISQSVTVVNHGHFGGHDAGAFEHGGHGVPHGYHASAHAGSAGHIANHSSQARTQGRTQGGKQTGNHGLTTNARNTNHGSSNHGTSQARSRSGSGGQSHSTHNQNASHHSNSASKGTRTAQSHNSQSSRTGTHAQARSNSGTSHAQARTGHSTSTNHAQARNSHASAANRSQAHSSSAGMKRTAQTSRSGGASSHSQARTSRSSGTANRGSANRSSASHSQARTGASHQSSARSSGHASAGKRR